MKKLQLLLIGILLCGLLISGVSATLPTPNMLLHMNGVNDGTTFIDEMGKVVTVNSATTNTTQRYLGYASGRFNGINSNLTLPASSDWDLGSENFTIMWWENRTSASDGSAVISQYGGTSSRGWMLGYSGTGTNYLYLSSTGNSWDIASGVSMGTQDLNQWNQFAAIRNGTSIKTYKNGVEISSVTTSATIHNPGLPLVIGDVGASAYYGGFLDEVALWGGGPALTIDKIYPMTIQIGTTEPQWDIGTNWTLINNAAFPKGKIGFTLLNCQNVLYAIAGTDGIRTNSTHKSTDYGKTFTLVNASAGFSNRSFAAGWVYHNTMYLAGGYDGTKNLNDVWKSSDGNIWTLANTSAGFSVRHAAMALVINDKMYLMGGTQDGGNKNDIWTSIDGNIWTKVTTTSIWPAREYGGAGNISNSMYVWGGLGTSNYLSDVWESDNFGTTWYQINASGFESRYGFPGVSADSRLMFGGGTNATNTIHNFYTSTPGGIIWSVKNNSIIPFDRYYSNMVVVNDSGIVMIGGYNTTSGFLNDVWVSGNIPESITPPPASFVPNKTSGITPLSVAFTDTSSGTPNIWVWSVNGTEIQNSSIINNFTYTFYPIGEHRINLTVWNTTLATTPSTASRNVTVNASIVADFAGAPTSGFATLPVSFVDMSTPADIYAWYWEFGDGSNSTERNPTHSYTSAGLYTVNLTATNVDGSDTESKVAYIDVSTSADPNPDSTLKFKPDLNIIGNQSRYNQTIQIQNVSVASYANGSTTFDPSHLFATRVYANTSTYAGNTLVESTIDNTTGVVTWQVMNAGGYTAGSIPVSIIDIEMFQKSYAVGSITQSPGSGNLGNATYNTSHAIVYSESANFTYAPWITYSNFTISNYNPVIFEDTVTFTSVLPSNITADRWLWDFGDGNSTLDTTGGPVTYKYMTFSANTTLYPKLTAYLAANTSVTNTTTLTISPVYNVSFVGAAFSGSPLTGNAGLSVSFTDQSAFGAPESTNPRSYNWSFGDGTYSDIKGSTSHVYTALGTYTVSLSVGNSYGNSTETKVNYIIISNSQQTTWYSPKQIGITAVYRDPAGIRIPNASMTLRAIGSTIPATATTDTQQSLQLFYGINPTAANLMMNNTLIMAGTTGGDGSASFTVLASISYQVNITDPKTGVVWSSDISPSDPLGMYTIWVGNTPFAGEANTTINYLNQTKLYITQPDPGNVTFNLIYKDTSGLTTDVIFEIIAANNKTRVYGVDLGNPGTSAVLANYTLPNVIDNTYYFGYNATRSE